MNKFRSRTFTAVLSLFAGVSLLPVLASAQATPPAASSSTTATDPAQMLEKFEVTGSYLPVSSTVTASPVVTLQSSELGVSGSTDALQLLRQLTPYFAGNGNLGTEMNNGGAGESNVALRNLSTLVLVN